MVKLPALNRSLKVRVLVGALKERYALRTCVAMYSALNRRNGVRVSGSALKLSIYSLMVKLPALNRSLGVRIAVGALKYTSQALR